MTNERQPRKEPIPIEEESSHSPLYPQDKPRVERYPQSPSNGGKNSIAIIAVILLLIQGGIGLFLYKTFSPTTTTMDVVIGQVNQLQESIDNTTDGLKVRLENLINSIGNYAKKTDLSAYALNSQLAGLVTLEELNTKLDELKVLLQTDIDAAMDAISELEDIIDGIGTDTNSPSTIDADIQVQFGEYIVIPHGSTSEISVPLRIILHNNTAENLKDVRLTVYFESSSYLSSVLDWTSGYPTLNGGVTTWVQTYPNIFAFQNGWGLNLSANADVTINLVLTIKLDTALTMDTSFLPQVVVE